MTLTNRFLTGEQLNLILIMLMEVKRFTESDLSSLQLGSELLKRILIVDDDRDIVFTLKSILEGYYTRFEVFSYADSIEIFSTFKAAIYDLALIDINMPLMNGFQCVETNRIGCER